MDTFWHVFGGGVRFQRVPSSSPITVTTTSSAPVACPIRPSETIHFPTNYMKSPLGAEYIQGFELVDFIHDLGV